jgi:hypothetical protein
MGWDDMAGFDGMMRWDGTKQRDDDNNDTMGWDGTGLYGTTGRDYTTEQGIHVKIKYLNINELRGHSTHSVSHPGPTAPCSRQVVPVKGFRERTCLEDTLLILFLVLVRLLHAVGQ